MQIEKAPINDRLRVSKISENFAVKLFIVLQELHVKLAVSCFYCTTLLFYSNF